MIKCRNCKKSHGPCTTGKIKHCPYYEAGIQAFKLVRVRLDGTYGPLFIDRKLVLLFGVWMRARAINTKGFKFRPGWHACSQPIAPHLSKRDRAWLRVSLRGVTEHHRPRSQGGLWYTAKQMRIDGFL